MRIFVSVFLCLILFFALCAVKASAQQKQRDTKQASEQLAEQMAQQLTRQLPQQLSQLSAKKSPAQPAGKIEKPSAQSSETRPGVVPAAPAVPAQSEKPKLRLPQDKPLGAAGPSRDRKRPVSEDAEFMVIQDRWRVGIPDDPRFSKGNIFNPYGQNVLKGDYPIIGNKTFLNVSISSETTFEMRRVPAPQDISARNPGSLEFFGRGRQDQIGTNFIVSADLFRGDASFKPVDWRFKITGIANISYLRARENGIVNVDVREGISRQKNFTSIEEMFFEYRLGDTTRIFPFLRGKDSKGGRSPEYDSTSIRVGIQPFTSDFRGFIFSDSNLGARLFGNIKSNRYQYNLAYFNMLEKNTNSGLNTLSLTNTQFKNQRVYIANLFRQDTFVPGYTAQVSLHYSDDQGGYKLDNNGFLVRPAKIGTLTTHRVRSGYFGFAGDGHFGRLNITHAAYQAIGRDTFNQIANRATRINAQMAAAELSMDFDYIRYRVGAFYSSGDANPMDGTGRGFDAILDNPNFAGGRFSFWNSQSVRLTQTGVALVEPRSIIPSLRSSKIEGQANFVNPGLTLYNAGIDFDVTPKLRSFINYNYIRFNRTEPLQLVLFQNNIRHEVGHDLGVGFIYRPLLNENIVFTSGVNGLRPGRGFTDIYTSNCNGTPQGCGASRPNLWSFFMSMRFTY